VCGTGGRYGIWDMGWTKGKKGVEMKNGAFG